MAALHGKGGSASFTGLTMEVLSWSANATADVDESTVMGSATKTYLAGYNDWTASVECVLPAAGMGVIGTVLGSSATLTLNTAAGGRKYSGTAICTGISPASSKDGKGTCSYNFQGNGALAEGAV